MSAGHHTPVSAHADGQPSEPSRTASGLHTHREKRPDRNQPTDQNTEDV